MALADIRFGLYAYLLVDAAISTKVGGIRIYPIKLPQGQTKASIVYSRISGLNDHHSQGPSGLVRPRIQIDCWALDPNEACVLAGLVKERLDGFSGDMAFGTDSPQESITVQGVFADSQERDSFDDTTKLYGMSRDYFIWFEER